MRNFPKDSVLGSLKTIRNEISQIAGQVGTFVVRAFEDESEEEIFKKTKSLGHGFVLAVIMEDFTGVGPKFVAHGRRYHPAKVTELLQGEGNTRQQSLIDLENKIADKVRTQTL